MNLRTFKHLLITTALVLPIVACSSTPPVIPTAAPTSIETTATYEALRNLPAPKKPVPVAVYGYPDLTGQFKPTETVSTNSRAVTQGASWMLVKALKDAAAGRWFKVIERANLQNLLKERQIIRETRGRLEKKTGMSQPNLPSLLFAGVILDGGIIGYDSNTITGGIGARYLGIGGDVQYRQDTVTIYLNAISSQTGEILKSVMTRKTVVSYGVRGSVFKFVAFQKLLEGETGYTVNEPGQIALAQAIEHAVRSLIIEGALENLWQFDDQFAGKAETQAYLEDKEDDLLLGEASSGVAQALLTDEQLQKIRNARKQRRDRLSTHKDQAVQMAKVATQSPKPKQVKQPKQVRQQQALPPIPTKPVLTPWTASAPWPAPTSRFTPNLDELPGRSVGAAGALYWDKAGKSGVHVPRPSNQTPDFSTSAVRQKISAPMAMQPASLSLASLSKPVRVNKPIKVAALPAPKSAHTPVKVAALPAPEPVHKPVLKQIIAQKTLAAMAAHQGTKTGKNPHYFRPEIKPAVEHEAMTDQDHQLLEASLVQRIEGAWATSFSELRNELADVSIKAIETFIADPAGSEGEDL